MHIEWNEQAELYLTHAQVIAFESGEDPGQLEGTIQIDAIGNVWYRDGEHRKHVGVRIDMERDLSAPAIVHGHDSTEPSEHDEHDEHTDDE